MSGLRVFRMKWHDVLFLAGDEYEAEAVRVEAAARLSALLYCADTRLEVLPDKQYVAAFDYLDPHRLIVVQDSAAWVRHYGCSLLMRIRVPAMKRNPTVPDGGSMEVALWNHAQPFGSYEAGSCTACLYASNLSEEERREFVLAWIADSGFEAGEIEASARYCAAEFLPASRSGREGGGRRG